MKTRIQTKNRNLWRDVLDWLRLTAKTLRKKLVAKGKALESFPNEAPH